MAGVPKPKEPQPTHRALTVSHRKRLVDELRADPGLAAEYVNAAADGDPRVYLLALRTVAEARGMARVAKAAGVPRESLYRALSSHGNPRLSTLHAILKATGLTMVVQASRPTPSRRTRRSLERVADSRPS
jgi:probable addiction module antidote protein